MAETLRKNPLRQINVLALSSCQNVAELTDFMHPHFVYKAEFLGLQTVFVNNMYLQHLLFDEEEDTKEENHQEILVQLNPDSLKSLLNARMKLLQIPQASQYVLRYESRVKTGKLTRHSSVENF